MFWSTRRTAVGRVVTVTADPDWGTVTVTGSSVNRAASRCEHTRSPTVMVWAGTRSPGAMAKVAVMSSVVPGISVTSGWLSVSHGGAATRVI